MITAIAACYGTSHLPFLGAWLEQLTTAFPLSVVPRVLLAELAPDAVRRWRAAYPSVEWVDGPGPGADDRTTRVARKLPAWLAALRAGPAIPAGRRLVCLDVDTLVLKDPGTAWDAGISVDFGYTERRGRWPVNSGVVFGTMSPRFVAEVAAWARETEHWLSAPARVQQAVDAHGAADQAALAVCLSKMEDAGGMSVRKFPADVWNCDTCPEGGSLDGVGILHLKGCLPLLLGERPYGPEYGDERRPADCEPAFVFWRTRWWASISRLAAAGKGRGA